jgi:ABC-type glycerol-3-phosphate transport system permease component
MFAPVIIIIPLYIMMNAMNLIDSYAGLIIMNVTFNLAFIVLMLKSSFETVPREVVEAAKIDGCSSFMTLRRIFVPISKTGIAVAVIFTFTRTWNEFLFAFTYISTSSKKPIIVGLYEILKNNPAVGIPWHLVMTSAVYATVPLVVLFILIRNNITGDLTAGAIK